MPSGNVPSFTDYAGNQTPDDLVYIAKDPFGLTDDRKSTLNDLFSVITKNITDGAVRFEEFTAPALSGLGEGSLYFDDTDKTFKGSRNGSAYDDLLFGNGANQQVAVFTVAIDTIAGYAPFYYNNLLERLYITDTVFSPTIEVSKTGTTPAYFKALGGQGYASIGNWSATVAYPAFLNFFRGASGPAFPTSGMDIGSIRFRPALDTGDVPTTVGGARIDVRATENAVLGVGGGVGLTIYTAANGQIADTQRMLINSAGVVMIGVNSATITTAAGTDTKTVLGELTTYDSDAIHQIGNPSASDAKILVIQGNAAQTKALTEWQTSAGAFLFSIGAFGSHSYGGTTGIAVSASGQGRIYFDSASNTFQVSQDGGAYVDLVSGGGLTIGTTTIASGAAGRILYETAANVLGEIPGSAVDANGAIVFDTTDRTSGVASYFTIKTPADTGQTASTESVGIYFGGNGAGATVTRTWATGALATQRENVFVAPTYAFVGASTLTTAATVVITGAPVAGTNATITKGYGLMVQSSPMRVDDSATASWTAPFAASLYAYNTTYAAYIKGVSRALWLETFNADSASYSFVVAANATSSTSGTVGVAINGLMQMGIGNATVALSPSAQIHAVSGSASRVGLRVESLANSTVALNQFYLNADDTNSVALHTVFSVDSNGTPAAGFGGQLLFQLESSTTNQQNAAAISYLWLDATHATRTAALQFQIVGNAAALATMAAFDVPTVAGDTALQIYDLDNATLERVSAGAADSGGAGFKVLRIPN